jgi:hypothetical protein
MPPGIEELDDGYGYGYGSWIRASEDREIANCSVELDEILGRYIVRCIVAELGADQELRLLIPILVQSRRMVYGCKFKPTETPEILELGEEVLQEPIEERPKGGSIVHAPESKEEPKFDINYLNQYLIHANQVDETQSDYDTIGVI